MVKIIAVPVGNGIPCIGIGAVPEVAVESNGAITAMYEQPFGIEDFAVRGRCIEQPNIGFARSARRWTGIPGRRSRSAQR